MEFLTDEHVPRVFVTTLRSTGHPVETANAVFGEATDDEQILGYCGAEGSVLITHDKKDFSGEVADAIDHAGIVIYTDANYLRDEPEAAVRTLESVLDHVTPIQFENQIVWLDEWRQL